MGSRARSLAGIEGQALALPGPLLKLGVLWTGLMAGFFYAFSVLVMPGLRETDQLSALAAMQEVNRAVDGNVFFGIGFFGAAIVLAINVILAAFNWRSPAHLLALIGSVLYLVGVFGVTVVFNVPMNDDLDLLDPANPANRAKMDTYIEDWSMWNDVRTIAALVAFAMFATALGIRTRNRGDDVTTA
jgi:uncharacterized membrane protein